MKVFKDVIFPIVQFAVLVSPAFLWVIKDNSHTHKMLDETTEKIDRINLHLMDIEMVAIRNELQQAMDHHLGLDTVGSIYDRYKKAGGNSYMEAEYLNYVKQFRKEHREHEKELY